MQHAILPNDIDAQTIASDSEDDLNFVSLTLTPQASYYVPATKIILKEEIIVSDDLSPATSN